MPSKRIITSNKSARQVEQYKKPRPISMVGGGMQGGVLAGPNTGTGTER